MKPRSPRTTQARTLIPYTTLLRTDIKIIVSEAVKKLNPRTKPSISLVLHPKRTSKKEKSSNKSFDRHIANNSSHSFLALTTCLKKFQALTPGKSGSHLTSHTTAKRRKVQSTRSKQDIAGFSQKSQRNDRKSLHSNSLPPTPRIKFAKRLVHPEKLLDNLKFRAKRKDKRSGKRQIQPNFAQTSHALVAILKSLQPTSKSGNDYILKSYRTNAMATFSTEKVRPMRTRPIKDIDPLKPKDQINKETNDQVVNIDSVQIGFK